MNPAVDPTFEPILSIAERQLEMLGELAQIAMAVSRAFGSSAMAAAQAEKDILADEYFMPEVGRARACGAKDAAESFQKASRAVRLTLKMELAVAEMVRDIRAGTYTAKNAGGTPADQGDSRSHRHLGPSGSADQAPKPERLVEYERADILELDRDLLFREAGRASSRSQAKSRVGAGLDAGDPGDASNGLIPDTAPSPQPAPAHRRESPLSTSGAEEAGYREPAYSP